MSPTDDVPASSNRTNAFVNAGIEKQRLKRTMLALCKITKNITASTIILLLILVLLILVLIKMALLAIAIEVFNAGIIL